MRAKQGVQVGDAQHSGLDKVTSDPHAVSGSVEQPAERDRIRMVDGAFRDGALGGAPAPEPGGLRQQVGERRRATCRVSRVVVLVCRPASCRRGSVWFGGPSRWQVVEIPVEVEVVEGRVKG